MTLLNSFVRSFFLFLIAFWSCEVFYKAPLGGAELFNYLGAVQPFLQPRPFCCFRHRGYLMWKSLVELWDTSTLKRFIHWNDWSSFQYDCIGKLFHRHNSVGLSDWFSVPWLLQVWWFTALGLTELQQICRTFDMVLLRVFAPEGEWSSFSLDKADTSCWRHTSSV